MKRRGFSFFEGLMAAFMLAVVIMGLYSGFNVCFTRILHSNEVILEGQLARAEAERAKVFGPSNFPLGTYSSGTSTATWTGTWDPTANSGAGSWVSGGTAYYDVAGTRLTSATNAFYSSQVSVTDSSVLPSNGGSYEVVGTSRRAVIVTVTKISDTSVVVQFGTNLVIGGL